MDKSYVRGFMDKCAKLGVDPEALVKSSQELTEASDTANAVAGRLGAVGGGVAGASAGIPAGLIAALFKRPGLGAGIAAGGTALGALAGRGIGRALVPNKYKPAGKLEQIKQKLQELIKRK